MNTNSHNVPTKNKLGISRMFQFTFVNLQSRDCKPFFAFIVAENIIAAKYLFSHHLGDSFEILDIQTINEKKHDIVILSSCPLFDDLISDKDEQLSLL